MHASFDSYPTVPGEATSGIRPRLPFHDRKRPPCATIGEKNARVMELGARLDQAIIAFATSPYTSVSPKSRPA